METSKMKNDTSKWNICHLKNHDCLHFIFFPSHFSNFTFLILERSIFYFFRFSFYILFIFQYAVAPWGPSSRVAEPRVDAAPPPWSANENLNAHLCEHPFANSFTSTSHNNTRRCEARTAVCLHDKCLFTAVRNRARKGVCKGIRKLRIHRYIYLYIVTEFWKRMWIYIYMYIYTFIRKIYIYIDYVLEAYTCIYIYIYYNFFKMQGAASFMWPWPWWAISAEEYHDLGFSLPPPPGPHPNAWKFFGTSWCLLLLAAALLLLVLQLWCVWRLVCMGVGEAWRVEC